MKLILILFFIVVSPFIYSQQNDLSKANLKGSVKSVRTIEYRAIQKRKKIELGSVHPNLNFKIDYDKNGNDSIRSYFRFVDDQHKMTIYTTYNYSGSSKVELQNYTSDGKQFGYGKYIYESDFRLRLIEYYNSNDTIDYLEKYNYDVRGQTKASMYNLSDTATFTIRIYNENGDMLEQHFYLNGALNYSKQFNYDDKRNMTSWIYKNEEIEAEYQSTYEFDVNGNWIKKIESLNGKILNITEREIEYYN